MQHEQGQQAPRANPRNKKPHNDPQQVGEGPFSGSAGAVESGRGYLTVKEVARYLGMKTSTIYAWVPEIPHYKVGNLLRFKKEDVDAWMETKREGGEAQKISAGRIKGIPDVDDIVKKAIDAARGR